MPRILIAEDEPDMAMGLRDNLQFEGYDVDPAIKRERFDEALMLVERLLAGERVHHAGQFHTLRDVRLNVLPVQARVPIHVAILRREAAYHIGRQGRRMLFVPRNCGHALITLEENTEVHYMVSEFYMPSAERGARFDDPAFGIEWPMEMQVISEKDDNWPPFEVQRRAAE